jgi:electron transfer flavoprotein alpha subunit
LAIRLQSDIATGVISGVQLEGDQYLVTRTVFAGKATATLKLKGKCKLITLSAGASAVNPHDILVKASEMPFNSSGSIKILETKRVLGKTPLPEAELVVSAGRGLKDPANWGIVEELADVIGATTACSRPVADAGWRPHHEHVGQTGIAIKPKLYIALGISGAIQHLAGVNNSKVIVVINKDPEAPFFKAADYGIVGDVFDIVPKLTAAIRKIKSQS